MTVIINSEINIPDPSLFNSIVKFVKLIIEIINFNMVSFIHSQLMPFLAKRI